MIKKNKKLKIVAHRGASSLAPENTLAAFRKAKEINAKAIELDVHLSADGYLIVHHDYYLGHPDNGSGLIREKSLAEIQKADAGNWFGSTYAQEKIPTLNEVFEEFGNYFEYELELKDTTRGFLDKILKLADQHNIIHHIEFTSPHMALLSKLRQLRQDIKIGVFFTDYPQWMSRELGESIILDTMRLMTANVAHLPSAIITKQLVSSLHSANFLVHVANCNTAKEIKLAIELNCDQLSTNEYILATKILNS